MADIADVGVSLMSLTWFRTAGFLVLSWRFRILQAGREMLTGVRVFVSRSLSLALHVRMFTPRCRHLSAFLREGVWPWPGEVGMSKRLQNLLTAGPGPPARCRPERSDQDVTPSIT